MFDCSVIIFFVYLQGLFTRVINRSFDHEDAPGAVDSVVILVRFKASTTHQRGSEKPALYYSIPSMIKEVFLK